MRIIIFEAQGYSTPTNFDSLLINLHSRNVKMEVSKINVLDAASMKSHKDVVAMLKKDGLDVLPLIKLDKKLLSVEKAIETIMKSL